MAWVQVAISTFIPDLRYLLENEFDPRLVYGQNLFVGPKARIPDKGGPFVSLISSGGSGAEGTHNSPDFPAYETPKGQVLVRAIDYADADFLCQQIYFFFYGISNRKINGTWWKQITTLGEPFDLPPDEKERPRRAFNLQCVKRVSPETTT